MKQGRSETRSKIREYYDSLTDEELEEERAWGRFAESQLAKAWADVAQDDIKDQ